MFNIAFIVVLALASHGVKAKVEEISLRGGHSVTLSIIVKF